ncbi:hypothetical protein Abr02nite_56090 [Paractinoplanes brasiliensis]|nr:hypothetical protein Abr02nite_56090 [Actinoplanes brasiliensis]
MASDVTGGHLDQPGARQFLRLGHRRLDAGDEGFQFPGGGRWVTTTTLSIPAGGSPPQPSVMSKTWRPTTVTPIRSQYGRVWSYDVCETFTTPLPSSGTSPLVSQSNSGPGWSLSSAMKPSTDTELYMTTLPTGLSSGSGALKLACGERLFL